MIKRYFLEAIDKIIKHFAKKKFKCVWRLVPELKKTQLIMDKNVAKIIVTFELILQC